MPIIIGRQRRAIVSPTFPSVLLSSWHEWEGVQEVVAEELAKQAVSRESTESTS